MILSAMYHVVRGTSGDCLTAQGEDDIYQVPVIGTAGHVYVRCGIPRLQQVARPGNMEGVNIHTVLAHPD